MLQQGVLECDPGDDISFGNMVAPARSHVRSMQPKLLALLKFALPTLKPYVHFAASALESSTQKTVRDIRKLSKSNRAGEGLPLLMFTLTGRKTSDPSVVGHKGMKGEWKLHSFQAKIKALDNFVSPLMNLKLQLTRPGFSLIEARIIFSL